jgi:hypothetical protein
MVIQFLPMGIFIERCPESSMRVMQVLFEIINYQQVIQMENTGSTMLLHRILGSPFTTQTHP